MGKVIPIIPTWHEYFMSMAKTAATRSSCIKRQVGAVLVIEKRLIGTGYNGTPVGVKNCNEGGCKRCNDSSIPSGTRLDECWCNHAEENCISQSARYGVKTAGATLYTTFSPCITCAKIAINAGIIGIVFGGDYPQSSKELLESAGIWLVKYEEQVKEQTNA